MKGYLSMTFRILLINSTMKDRLLREFKLNQSHTHILDSMHPEYLLLKPGKQAQSLALLN